MIPDDLEYGVGFEAGRFASRIEMRGQHFIHRLVPRCAFRIFHQSGQIVSGFRTGHSNGPFHAEAAHFTIDGRSTDTELSRCLCWLDSCLDQFDSRIHLGHVERLTSRLLALGACGRDAVPGSLRDQPPLEMGNCSEHMEDQFAGGR